MVLEERLRWDWVVILFFLSLELRGMLKSYLRSTKVTFFWIQSVFVFFFAHVCVALLRYICFIYMKNSTCSIQSDKFWCMYIQWASEAAQWSRICLQCRRPGFDHWVRKISWRRECLPTPIFLPGEFHGQRSRGYSPWGCKESDKTQWQTLSYTYGARP